MSEYYSILTNKGEKALFESIAGENGFNPFYIAVGDSLGSYYEPEETQTALKNEKYRAEIYAKGINRKDKFLYFDLQIPPSEGDYTIREVGLFNKDNELLGIAKYPATLKQKADTQSDKTLSVEFQIFLSNETINTIVIDDNGNLLTKETLNADAQPYDKNRNYFKTEWATDIIDGKKSIFESLIGNNQGNSLTDKTKWKKVSLGGGGRELLEIYIDPFIDETDNKGRILNGQVFTFDEFPSAVAKLKRRIGTLTDGFNPLSVQKYGNIKLSAQGIASGFDSTSWVTIPEAFNPQNQNWQIGVAFRTGEFGSERQDILNCINQEYESIEIKIEAGNKIVINSFINNSTTRLFQKIIDDVALSSHTDCFFLMEYDSNIGYTFKLGENKDNLSTVGTVDIKTPITQGAILAFGANFGANQQYVNGAFQGSINLFDSFVKINGVDFFNPKRQVYSKMPEIACSEAEWQTLKRNSPIGQVSKFVIDEENKTVRLPAVKNIQGVYALVQSGMTFKQSLPNLKWEINSNSTAGDFSFFGEWHEIVTTQGGIKADYITTNKGLAEHDSAGAKRLFSLSYNANDADSTYQDGAPVQVEACGYPYCICLNPEVEESEKPINEYEIINSNTLLEPKYSPLELDNLSWLKSAGQRNPGTTFVAIWNKLIESYNTNSKIGIADVKLVTDSTATDYDFKIDLETSEFILPLLDGSENFPSYEYITLEPLATNINGYTAPYNGFLHAHMDNGSIQLFIADSQIGTTAYSATITGSNNTIFLKKGQKAEIAASGAIQNIEFTKAKGNGNLYFYAGDTAQNTNLINAGRFEEQLADINSASRSYLIESYTNGRSWYRIYSDGYCEQGGQIQGGSDTTVTITLLKNYKDMNYNVGFTTIGNNSSSATTQWQYIQIHPLTTSTFSTKRINFTRDWRAYGYIK